MNGEYAAEITPAVESGTSGDQLASLFDTHYQRLYRLARRLAPSTDDALDIVQEAFVRAARNPSSIPKSTADQEAWLIRVLINLRHDQWRKSYVRARYAKAAAAHPPLPNNRGAENALLARTVVWQALEALPPRRRAIVVMFELEGLDVPEISRLLNIRAVTVRWHLSMGRRELARTLNVNKGESKR